MDYSRRSTASHVSIMADLKSSVVDARVSQKRCRRPLENSTCAIWTEYVVAQVAIRQRNRSQDDMNDDEKALNLHSSCSAIYLDGH